MYRQKIETFLMDILREKGVEGVTPQVDYPADSTHGDYATNLALVVFPKLKKEGKNGRFNSPAELAQAIVSHVTKETLPFIEKVEIAGPGFINFTLSKEALIRSLEDSSHSLSMTSSLFAGKKVVVEYTDPNPFKEFHIGHLYTNIIGESLARLFEFAGAKVQRACYQGDVGLHVAKAIWGMSVKIQSGEVDLNSLEQQELVSRAKFLGEAYALGATKFEEDESAKAEIIEINKKVYAKDPETMKLYDLGKAWSLAYFEEIYRRLGTKFDHYYFESQVGEYGLALVREYLEKGVFEESNGAVIFPGEKYGLHSRVFINSLGLPTYEAKELGLAPLKYKDFAYDQSIIVTGNEINEYFKVLLKALEQIVPDLAEKTTHLSHGMVKLPEGKMSSRTGKVISGEWLLNEAQSEARKKIEASDRVRIEDAEKDEVSDMIGKAAIKWALLRSGVGKDVEFSFSDSISFEGNSGPYVQYTFARTQSVLRKAGSEQKEVGEVTELNEEEKALLRHLVTFEEIVLMAAESYSPNTVSTYLYELAQKFNNFYQKHQIIDSEQKNFRLILTQKVGETIKDGLYLLGIESPSKM